MVGVKGNPNATGCSRKHLFEGLKDSLARMQLDYVDLVYCHREDPSTPIEETVRAMSFLIDQGMALYWGASEWSPTTIAIAIETATRLSLHKPVMEQPQYSALHRKVFEVDYQPIFAQYGYGTTIWSPLASGLLTGKYSGGVFPEGSRLAHAQNAWLKAQLESGDGLEVQEVQEPKAVLAKER
jgi:aryl-alcohol dehydrogenase-like predicted oxidoreductase